MFLTAGLQAGSPNGDVRRPDAVAAKREPGFPLLRHDPLARQFRRQFRHSREPRLGNADR